MGASKIQDETELLKWFEEGRTYRWMVDQYEARYNLQVGISMFSNFRRRRGLDSRLVRDTELIPWTVKEDHRYAYPVMNLRYEARRRAGESIPEVAEKRLDGWLKNLREEDRVIHYDPDTTEGWFYVPRRPGIDNDIIREPDTRRVVKR